MLDRGGKLFQHLLGHLELRPTICAHLFLGGERLGDTDAGDLFRFRFGQGADLGSLLNGALVFGLALVGLNIDIQLGLGHFGLHMGSALGLAQFAFLDSGLFLATIGFHLFRCDLPGTQLCQDGFNLRIILRRRGRADQHFF